MNTDNFLINNSDIETAQNICKLIEDDNLRNRAVANAVAAEIAANFFDKEAYSVDSQSGLHNIGFVLENIDISDIYINENYIDVRVFFNEDEISVPVAHFSNNLLPTAYMFIKINEDLSGANVVGFIEPSAIVKENPVNGYYQVNESDLKSFYDIEPLLETKDDINEAEDKDIFAYLDNNLDDVSNFYAILIHSKISRERLAKAAKAKEIFRFVSVTKELKNDEQNNIIQEEVNEPELNQDADLIADSDLSLEAYDSEELTLDESADLFEVGTEDSFDIDSVEEDNLIPEFEPSDESFDLDISEPDDNEISLEANPETDLETIEANDTETEGSATELNDLTDSEREAELERSISNFSENIGFVTNEENNFNTVEIQNEQIEESESLNLEDEIQMQSDIEISDESEEINIDNSDNNISAIQEEVSPLIIDDDGIDNHENSHEHVTTAEPETNADFEFSTVTTPSIDTDDILEELSNEPENNEPVQITESHVASEEQEEHIEALFNNNSTSEYSDNSEESFEELPKNKTARNPLVALVLLFVIGAAGYFGYTKFFAPSASNDVLSNEIPSDATQVVNNNEPVAVEEAMPIETVTNVAQNNSNEGIAETIPVIEQNLDASILVSNLKVDWEVPAGYASNTSAKRYLVKLGKIIQLNLKTELLLLSKPPITNKIAVEIKYNSDNRKFEANGITVSSGEKSVDDLILQTVNKALAMNLSMNTDSFAKLQGNPVLIIHL